MDEAERREMLEHLEDPEALQDLLARVEADPAVPDSIKYRRRMTWNLKDRDVVLVAVLGYWQGRGLSQLQRDALQALWEKETGQLAWSDATGGAKDDAGRP
jgi:hypothetical protein